MRLYPKNQKFSVKGMGRSMAATWSWGASLLVGISIVIAHGFFPYLIWLVGNILAIPFFGYVYTKIPNVRKWTNLIPFIGLWIFIQIMAIVMNLNYVQGTLSGRRDLETAFSLDPVISFSIVFIMAIGLLIYISKKKLFGSYFTDNIQYRFQLIATTILAIITLSTGFNDFSLVTSGGWHWSIFAFLGIISGVTAGGQQWQRLERMKDKDKLRTTLWGGFYFGIYMIPCALVAISFTAGILETTLLFLIVVAVTSSTIDSGYAGLQYTGDKLRLNKHIPTIVSILAIISFPLLADWGMAQIWTFYAGVRWKVVFALLAITIIYNFRNYLFLPKRWKRKMKQ